MRTLDYQARVLDTFDVYLDKLKAAKAEADKVEDLKAQNPGLPIPSLDFTGNAWSQMKSREPPACLAQGHGILAPP